MILPGTETTGRALLPRLDRFPAMEPRDPRAARNREHLSLLPGVPALSPFTKAAAVIIQTSERTCARSSGVGMASVFWGGGKADEVVDFDEYDPTPYGGGYDIALTFGRALAPSDETCYPISTATSSSSFSSDRPQHDRRPETDESHRRRPQAEESHGSAGYAGGGGVGYGRKAHDDDDDDGYRKLKPACGDERPKPKYHGEDDDRPSYGRKKNDDDDEERKPRYKKRDDDDDERKPRYKKRDDNDDDNDERKPRYQKRDDDDDDGDDKKKRYGKNNRRRHDDDD